MEMITLTEKFEKRHFRALEAIGDAMVMTIKQDEMPLTLFALRQIDALHPGVFFTTLEFHPNQIKVKRTDAGRRAVYHSNSGFLAALENTEPDDLPDMPHPIDGYFGLTHAEYLTIPRLALVSASQRWQQKFVDLLNELEAEGITTPIGYTVIREGYTTDDPWADYRTGDAQALSAEERAHRSDQAELKL